MFYKSSNLINYTKYIDQYLTKNSSKIKDTLGKFSL